MTSQSPPLIHVTLLNTAVLSSVVKPSPDDISRALHRPTSCPDNASGIFRRFHVCHFLWAVKRAGDPPSLDQGSNGKPLGGTSTHRCSETVRLKGSEACFSTTVPHVRHEDTLGFFFPSSLQRNSCRSLQSRSGWNCSALKNSLKN